MANFTLGIKLRNFRAKMNFITKLGQFRHLNEYAYRCKFDNRKKLTKIL